MSRTNPELHNHLFSLFDEEELPAGLFVVLTEELGKLSATVFTDFLRQNPLPGRALVIDRGSQIEIVILDGGREGVYRFEKDAAPITLAPRRNQVPKDSVVQIKQRRKKRESNLYGRRQFAVRPSYLK